MMSTEYWKCFIDSGAPEYYLLYSYAKKMEEADVFNDKGTGASGLAI